MTDMLGSQRGLFSQGTVSGRSINMYDAKCPNFIPGAGIFEDSKVQDQGTAQTHFHEVREIRLKAPLGSNLPESSYRHHYPPKEALLPGDDLELPLSGLQFPFDDSTTYGLEFYNKEKVTPKRGTRQAAPFLCQPSLVKESTYTHFHRPYEVVPSVCDYVERDAAAPPTIPSIYQTTYKCHFVPKQLPDKQIMGIPLGYRPLPWLNDGSTYQNHYYQASPLLLMSQNDLPYYNPYPFSGITEYTAEYIPKDRDPHLPPLTGILSNLGLQLPVPRHSLGVQFMHQGTADQYYIIIPRSLDAPCSARQIFTTVHDNQEQACILVQYGDDPVVSNNLLLGQFNIINIPPALKEVPRIEVIFRIDKHMHLTVEARDLDTYRHKIWKQSGAIVVLKD